MENLPSVARASESWKAVVFGWPTRCAISSTGPPTTTDALSRLVSWSCSRPKPAMDGCSTAPISSPPGSPEMAQLNRSRSWKPRPRLPSNGRAAIGSVGRRSSIRIRIPVASSPSSDTQPTDSPTSNNPINPDQAENFKYFWLEFYESVDDELPVRLSEHGLLPEEAMLLHAERREVGIQTAEISGHVGRSRAGRVQQHPDQP